LDDRDSNPVCDSGFNVDASGFEIQFRHAICTSDERGQIACVVTSDAMRAMGLCCRIEVPTRAHAIAA
jgi:hypothetical protein